jgi:hypothetical protein
MRHLSRISALGAKRLASHKEEAGNAQVCFGKISEARCKAALDGLYGGGRFLSQGKRNVLVSRMGCNHADAHEAAHEGAAST